MTVKELMSTDIVAVDEQDPVSQVAQKMSNHKIGAVPVVNGSDVRGIITDRDIVLRCVAKGKNSDNCKAVDVMTPSACCISANQPIADAVRLMGEQQVRRLPVVDNGRISGMISLGDVAKSRVSTEISQALAEISMP